MEFIEFSAGSSRDCTLQVDTKTFRERRTKSLSAVCSQKTKLQPALTEIAGAETNDEKAGKNLCAELSVSLEKKTQHEY